MLSTTALFYGAGMSILHLSGNDNMRGLFTIALGVFNLLFAYPLLKRGHVDKSLIYLLVGMVLTFVSLAAPVQLSGNYITLFWTTEMVVLLWLAQKSNIQFMKWSSLIIFGLMLLSLLMDWQQIYFDSGKKTLAILANKGMITTVFSLLGIATYYRLLKNNKTISYLPGISIELLKNVLKIVGVSLIYLIGIIEITYQIDTRMAYAPLSSISALAYTYLILVVLVAFAKKTSNLKLEQGLMFASGVALLSYLFFNEIVKNIRADYLLGEIEIGAFLMQYATLLLVSVLGVLFYRHVKSYEGLHSDKGKVVVLGLSLFTVLVATMQLNHHAMLFYFDEA